ncbi:hypothetical protein KSS87_004142 [Heliosperma pusillum]|nr:hypothetical protein KSS87_012654 [Heliosperma pusillum]KAH9624284.1 hypothetical protein KSS87_004142 [Heliosperma pusillum]
MSFFYFLNQLILTQIWWSLPSTIISSHLCHRYHPGASPLPPSTSSISNSQIYIRLGGKMDRLCRDDCHFFLGLYLLFVFNQPEGDTY